MWLIFTIVQLSSSFNPFKTVRLLQKKTIGQYHSIQNIFWVKAIKNIEIYLDLHTFIYQS